RARSQRKRPIALACSRDWRDDDIIRTRIDQAGVIGQAITVKVTQSDPGSDGRNPAVDTLKAPIDVAVAACRTIHPRKPISLKAKTAGYCSRFFRSQTRQLREPADQEYSSPKNQRPDTKFQ